MPDIEGLSPLPSSTLASAIPTIEDDEATYRYEPIVADEELRVLLLEPGIYGQPLVGSLLVRKIGEMTYRDYDWIPQGDGNEWDCVSYCWGSKNDYTYFSCDGRSLRITASVEDMLRHLRRPFMPRYVWIDAVCINQADDTEKSLQVLSMGRIYAIASNVVVWLGPVADQDRMYDLLSIFDVLDEFRLHGVPDPPIDSVSFAFPSLDALFSRKWFTRRWVLQEVFLSRAMIVQCGPHKFSWQSLRHSADLRLEHENNYHWGTGTGQAAYHVTRLDFERNFREFDLRHGKLFNDTSGKVYPRLLHLLTVFRTTQCADARDRLYSLNGMSPNLYDLCPVDYEVHFSRTYTDFAHATITTGRGHEVLHHAISFGNLSQQDESWPSWVPNWNIMDKMPHLRQFIYLAVKDEENSLTWGCFADTAHCRYSDQFTKANIGEMRGLCLSGKVHPIGDTQTSRGCSTAMQFFMDRLSRWPVAGPSHDSLTSSTSVLSVAIYSAKFSCVKSEGGVNRLPTTLLPSREEETWTVSLDRQTDLIHRIIDTEMRKQLPNATIAPADFDSTHFLQEANQLLDGQYAFRLDTSDELIFGLAFVRVEPKDLVFRRKTTLAPGLVVEPVCALVIRPY